MLSRFSSQTPNPTTCLPGGVASMKAGATEGGEVNLGAESQVYRPVSVLSQSAGQRRVLNKQILTEKSSITKCQFSQWRARLVFSVIGPAAVLTVQNG